MNGQLARHMNSSREENWKAMDIFVGCIKVRQKHEWIINKTSKLRTVSYRDYSYEYFKDTRKSTMG